MLNRATSARLQPQKQRSAGCLYSVSAHLRAVSQASSPKMVTFTEGQHVNSRGQTLYTVQYMPEGQPTAALVFHHGYGEHVGRYVDGG